jgi:hypothetical protein
MLRYFLDDREVSEADAATAWFVRADYHGIDAPKAIGIWKMLRTLPAIQAGTVAQSGIRVEVCRK